jgi:hypothetical protein
MAYFVAAASPTMEVANALLPVYVGVVRARPLGGAGAVTSMSLAP